MIDLVTLSSLVGVLTFICGAFNYVVIKPLRKAIDELRSAIQELRTESKERSKIMSDFHTRLTLIEDLFERLEKRVDKLER